VRARGQSASATLAVIADDLPTLIASIHSAERVEMFFGGGFRPKEFRREFDRPGDMAFKGAIKNSSGGIPNPSACLP